MSDPKSPEEISKVFNEVFNSKAGQIVLSKIKSFCLGNVNQQIARFESTNQTYYNLGANSVYRYIQYYLDRQSISKNKDCVIEKPKEQGE